MSLPLSAEDMINFICRYCDDLIRDDRIQIYNITSESKHCEKEIAHVEFNGKPVLAITLDDKISDPIIIKKVYDVVLARKNYLNKIS